jgi:uncharacterized membrane protein YgcG
MKKLLRARPWLVVVAAVALGTPVVAAGVALASGVADPNDYVRSVEYVHAVSAPARAVTESVTATCPAPKKVIGGGAGVSVTTSFLRTSMPLAGGTGWTASATGIPFGKWTVEVWAVCADVHGTGPSIDQSSSGAGGSSGTSGTSGQTSSGAGGSSGTSGTSGQTSSSGGV